MSPGKRLQAPFTIANSISLEKLRDGWGNPYILSNTAWINIYGPFPEDTHIVTAIRSGVLWWARLKALQQAVS
jgi:hypothetical protein